MSHLLPLPYLDYAREHFFGDGYNLATSNVPALDLHTLYPDPDDLRAFPEALTPHLEALLAERYNVAPEQVLLTHGTTGANLAIMAAVAPEGGDWLAETPGYEALWTTPALYGLHVHTFHRPDRDDQACTLDPDAVDDALQHLTRPRVVALTNPHNPSGRLASPGALAAVAASAERAGATLLVDEIYLDFAQHLGGSRSAIHLGDNVVITSSFSKVYGLRALRIGWAVGPPDLIRRARLAQLHTLGPLPGPSLAFASRALRELDDLKERATAHLRGRRDALTEAFSHHPALRWWAPDTGVAGLLEVHGAPDDLRLAARLRDLANIIVAPASLFGRPGALRIGFGTHPERFQTALQVFLHTVEYAIEAP